MAAARAFTLLESLVALVILTSLVTSVFVLRSEGIEAGVRVERALTEQRAADHVMRLALEGLLGAPDTPPETAGNRAAARAPQPTPGVRSADRASDGTASATLPPPLRWSGTALGVDYVCTRTFVFVEAPELPPPPGAPIADAEEDLVPRRLAVALFEVRCGSVVIRRHTIPEL